MCQACERKRHSVVMMASRRRFAGAGSPALAIDAPTAPAPTVPRNFLRVNMITSLTSPEKMARAGPGCKQKSRGYDDIVRSEAAGMNRIDSIEVLDHSLNSAEAEIWVNVVPARRIATTEIRGRFVGPRCASRSTVEVAYPLRQRTATPVAAATLTMRVVIPDPSLWTTEHPLEYDGQIALWQDGQRCDVRQVTLRLGQSGKTIL